METCDTALDRAQQRYAETDYAAVEALVSACVRRPEARAVQVQRAYRLLALALIRQDLLHDAQLSIVKLLGADYGYEPDPVQDPPFYVALVRSVKEQLRVAGPADPVRVVDVNTATAEELEAVPGIGPVMAGRIVAERSQNGPFRQVSELDRVAGIGPRTAERLAPYLTAEHRTPAMQAGGGVPATSVSPPSAPLAGPPLAGAEAESGPPPGEPLPGARLNLNTATAAELETLDGIGPALAARIVAYRETEGPFQRVEDVLDVRGIGPRTLERFAASVTVGNGAGE